MRLFILLCSDLAIRSGTAVKLWPDNYDEQKEVLRFTTNYGTNVALPVTAKIEGLLNECNMKERRSP